MDMAMPIKPILEKTKAPRVAFSLTPSHSSALIFTGIKAKLLDWIFEQTFFSDNYA